MPGKKTAKQSESCPSTPSKSKVDISEDAGKPIAIVSPSPKRPPAAIRSKSDSAKSPARKLDFGREESAPETDDAKRIQVPSNATAVYRVVNKATGTLGGNGYNGAIYGELTIGSMQKVINVLKEKCGMSRRSRFIDVGAGLGKPNFHAAQDPQVRVSLGIELEDIRWQLSMQNLTFVLKAAQKQPKKPVSDVPTVTPVSERASRKPSKQKPAARLTADLEEETTPPAAEVETVVTPLPIHTAVNFICNDIDEAQSLDPFTHIYMYDLGFPPPLQASIAKKFNTSVHTRYLVSYRPPRRVIDEYGYHVRHIHSLDTAMFGSGEHHMAYFYERILDSDDAATKAVDALKEKTKVTLPARQPGLVPSPGEEGDEQSEEVYCDPLFRESVLLAAGSDEDLLAHAQLVAEEFMNRGRARRDRKTRQLHNV